MDKKYLIVKASESHLDENEIRVAISQVFAEGFAQWLGFFSKDKDVIAKAFAHMFVLNQFYICIIDNKIAGMIACTNCNDLSVRLDKSELKKHLGSYKGFLAYKMLKKEFELGFDTPLIDTGSIEYVGTSSQFRSQGVASKIIKHIIENTTYQTFIIESVADTNIAAINLYVKNGFVVYKSKKFNWFERKVNGINQLFSYKLIK